MCECDIRTFFVAYVCKKRERGRAFYNPFLPRGGGEERERKRRATFPPLFPGWGTSGSAGPAFVGCGASRFPKKGAFIFFSREKKCRKSGRVGVSENVAIF